ncbi:hypothetical protein [Geodermatophilus sp. SYSU D00815]
MSMTSPLEPEKGMPDDGIPAADPGAGGPEPAEGFGIEGEEPDVAHHERADPPDDPPDLPRDDVSFRTPDPRDIGT